VLPPDRIAGREYPREEVRAGCPLCREIHEPQVFEGRFGMTVAVAECSSDRLAYQTPRPSLEASRAYMEMRWAAGDAYVADPARQLSRASRQLEQLSAIQEPGRLLDFGAGIGTFASVASAAGWAVDAVEASPMAIRRARSEFGVVMTREMPDGPFDAITLWDVVEHLRDPEGTVRDLAARLAPGGRIVFETGNWECWQRVAAGREWGLYLFDHQTYFSPPSLAELSARAGLRRFELLDGGHRRPSVRQLGAYRHSAVWGAHRDIEIMVCSAWRG
jgi:SAM-dependent methyltransferase